MAFIRFTFRSGAVISEKYCTNKVLGKKKRSLTRLAYDFLTANQITFWMHACYSWSMRSLTNPKPLAYVIAFIQKEREILWLEEEEDEESGEEAWVMFVEFFRCPGFCSTRRVILVEGGCTYAKTKDSTQLGASSLCSGENVSMNTYSIHRCCRKFLFFSPRLLIFVFGHT